MCDLTLYAFFLLGNTGHQLFKKVLLPENFCNGSKMLNEFKRAKNVLLQILFVLSVWYI